MIIEIRGVDFVNKGAELMLYAVVQQLNQFDDSAISAISLRNGSVQQRSEMGVQHLTWLYLAKAPFAGQALNTVAALLPAYLRHKWHIVRDNEIDIILDASGFLYSDDAWPKHMALSATKFKRLKQGGKKVILLPQAFGPFEKQRSKQIMQEILAHADLVYARDSQSYDYLRQLDSHSEHIRIAPDFTNLLPGLIPDYGNTLAKRPCIIPNYRMIDKTSVDLGEKYLPFLITSIRYLRQQGFAPFILIHETGLDYKLAEAVRSEIKQPIDIVHETNPLYIKGIVGNCFLTVGSRYHGLVSALSQNVPSIATGWSHKYQNLFEDYGCPECLVDLHDSHEGMLGKLELVVNETSRADILSRLSAASVKQKAQAQSMWDQVFHVIRNYQVG